MRLYNAQSQRLYLNQSERMAFLKAVKFQPARQQCFCEVLAMTGCRISEALALTPASVQVTEGTITFRTLKRRSRTVVREVPVPMVFASRLQAVFQEEWERPNQPLWNSVNRSTAYRWVKAAMADAQITGAMACPKGLRHGFGIHAVLSGVQLNMLQKWMGHATVLTTMIYANAIGEEERQIARKMWE